MIRYKKNASDDWYYMPICGGRIEMVARAKTVGKPELGIPAYHEVQVVDIATAPCVWTSTHDTIS